MKINIGCGKTYKEGFINIDSFDTTVADKKMSADDLKFSSNTVEEIHACQLIEHLGFIKTIYALTEWFRVLKPNGKLLIETPDLELSFKKFIKGDRNVRKGILSWIYGLETPGMIHKFCFPEELLEELLKKTGFIDIKKNHFEIEKDNPTLRIQCNKIKDYKPYQNIVYYRERLKHEKIVDTNQFFITQEQEKLIDFFNKNINKFYKNKDYKIFNNIIIGGAVHNVKMTYLFLDECIKNNIVKKTKIQNHIDTLEFLDRIDFQNVLYNLVKESADEPGTQNQVFQTICNIGKKSIKKLLTEEEKFDVKTSLQKLSDNCKKRKIDFFSDKLIDKEAANLAYKAIKEFILKKYKKALTNKNEAIKLDRNHLLYYWNQGRLFLLNKNISDGKRAYEKAIKLVKISEYKDKKKLVKALKKESENFSSKVYGKPITKI
jgi:tetratricopeptide (TPR) repeat protein